MKAYKLAIFDLDGTLLDTLQDLANSTNYALCAMGFPTRRIDEVRSFVGNGIKKLIERAVPTGTPSEDIEKTFSIFKSYYADHCEDKTKPYNGIMALLDRLKEENVLIAVVSNKIDSAVSVLCEKYFGDRIVMSVGDREGIEKKPAPDSVLEVLHSLDIKKEDAVYIGDSEVDIQTAKNAEMDCISVTWGFRDREYLANVWGFQNDARLQIIKGQSGVRYEKGLAYFADSPKKVEKILLSEKEVDFS